MGKGRRFWWTGLGVAAGVGCTYLLTRAYRAARETCPPFERQICTDSQRLVNAFGAFWRDPGLVRSLFLDLQVDRQLAQKLVLAVAGAEGWSSPEMLARHATLTDGLDRDEIRSLLRGELAQATDIETPALEYALCLSEAQSAPDPELERLLADTYGESQADALIAFVRLAGMAAMVGIALDAFVSRLLGKPAAGSSVVEEARTLALFVFGVIPLTPALVLRAILADT
ncbi:MAG: hypothetical protein JXA74_12985 [Anaerolineae bacterium]|nr:hypothetical protein [Anaerolineae bacterium]